MGIIEARQSAVRCAVTLEPREGDLVVTRDATPGQHHTVVQFPGLTLASIAAKDDAIELARDFAQLRSVDVWYADHGDQRLIEAFRPTESPRS